MMIHREEGNNENARQHSYKMEILDRVFSHLKAFNKLKKCIFLRLKGLLNHQVKTQSTMSSHIYFIFCSLQDKQLNFEEFQVYLRVTHNKNKETTAAMLRDIQMYLNETNQTTKNC